MRHITTKILLAVLTLLSATTLAAQTSGSCGQYLTWSFDSSTGILTISGRGDMSNSTSETDQPWRNYRAAITGLSLPSGLTSIGAYAFYDCDGLTSVTIPEGVTRIGASAFRSCSNLTSVSLPTSLTSISIRTFASCPGLTAMTIPEGVTDISMVAFENCTGLTSVSLPASLTTIGKNAFNGCSALTAVKVMNPTPLTIAEGTFSNRANATLTVPYGASDAYKAADYWKEFKYFHEGFFGTCGDNLCWSFDASTKTLTITGTGDMYDFGSSTMPWKDLRNENFNYIRSVSLPSGLTSIGNYAFYGCERLTSIDIPQGVTSIGEFAFYECKALTSVAIPQGVTTIRPYTFHGCVNLSSVTLPDGLTSIGDRAFYDCDDLTSITIPEGVTTIKPYTFAHCLGLTSVVIPESVTTIDQCAFFECSSLTAITLPSGLTAIGLNAFERCSALTAVTALNPTPVAITANVFSNRANAKLTVPYGAKAAYQAAAYWNEFRNIVEIQPTSGQCGDNLYWMVVGDNLTITGSGAMTDYEDEVDEPWYYYHELITSVSLPDGLTHIGTYAFSSCHKMLSINIPESVETIGEYAFSYCHSLKSIVLPEGLTTIEESTFDQCLNLTTVTLPEGITSIGNFAFFKCQSLTSISLPSTLDSIRGQAFQSCTSLTTVTLHESLTTIEYLAFKDCTSLTTVKAYMSEPFEFGISAFDNISDACKLIVPYGTTEVYEYYGWTPDVFPGGIEEMPGGSCGPDLTWTYDTDTRHLTITGSGEMEDFPGFRNRPWYSYIYSIESISLPDGLTSIGNVAFRELTKLTSVSIPEGVTRIGTQGFMACLEITSITLPSSLTSIGYSAFAGCRKLATVKAKMTEPCRIGAEDFSDIAVGCKLIIPAGTRQAYIDAGWTTDIFPGGIIEMGDANGDGTISVADIGLMIDHVLGNAPAGLDPAIADVNDDGEVNVDDLETVIKAMLEK